MIYQLTFILALEFRIVNQISLFSTVFLLKMI